MPFFIISNHISRKYNSSYSSEPNVDETWGLFVYFLTCLLLIVEMFEMVIYIKSEMDKDQNKSIELLCCKVCEK